jgi:hypothetical protein
MIEMIDRLLEVLVRCLLYLIRIVIRMMKERGSSTWPVEKGTVTGFKLRSCSVWRPGR